MVINIFFELLADVKVDSRLRGMTAENNDHHVIPAKAGIQTDTLETFRESIHT